MTIPDETYEALRTWGFELRRPMSFIVAGLVTDAVGARARRQKVQPPPSSSGRPLAEVIDPLRAKVAAERGDGLADDFEGITFTAPPEPIFRADTETNPLTGF